MAKVCILKNLSIKTICFIAFFTYVGYELFTDNDYICPDSVREKALDKVKARLKKSNKSGDLFEDRAGDKGCDLSYIHHYQGRALIHFVVLDGRKLVWYVCGDDCEDLKQRLNPYHYEINIDDLMGIKTHNKGSHAD